jgi:hypothetical protein
VGLNMENTYDMIKEKLQNGTDEEKDAMLQASEESLAQFAQKELSSLLQPLTEVDQGLLSDEHNERLIKILVKLRAMRLIASESYSNICVQQRLGLTLVREFGAGDTDYTGKVSCQITLS